MRNPVGSFRLGSDGAGAREDDGRLATEPESDQHGLASDPDRPNDRVTRDGRPGDDSARSLEVPNDLSVAAPERVDFSVVGCGEDEVVDDRRAAEADGRKQA